jgi:pyrroloquinoline quinone (PQQ) biosynthesis protein C
VVQAQSLIAQIRSELAGLSERVRRHDYIKALEDGRIGRDTLRIFAGEQYHIIKNDVRSFAILLSRQEDPEVRSFLVGSVEFEAAAFDALLPFAGALGMTVDALEAYEPLPGAHAYTAFLAETAMYGSAAEMAGAFIVDLEGWGGNCREMSRILKVRHGLTPAEAAFFDHFAADDPTYESRSLDLIDRVLVTSAAPHASARAVRRAARLMMSYEVMYWDTLLEASLAR